ncbi:MAG: DEAD/DEAH box helicase [bacterium]|nr:DEAD/DEAH box helicase [bacterium]
MFHEPGTGKTRTSIRILEHQYLTKKIEAAIIVVPKSMIKTWAYELSVQGTIPYSVYEWSGMLTNGHLDKYNQATVKDKLVYFITNHDSLYGQKFLRTITHFTKKYEKYAIIIDESTAIKTMKAERTKAAISIGHKAATRGILTGTPIVQSPVDIYSQTQFLQKDLLGFRSFFSFKSRYCEIRRQTFGMRQFDVVTGYRDLDDLRSKLLKFSSVVKLEDVVDMPERIFKTILVEMAPKQMEAYEELRKKAVAYIQEHEVTAVNALAMVTRLLQILSGQLKISDGVYVSIENNRLPALKELVDETPGQVLIWTSYVQTARDIVITLGKECIHYSSDLDIDGREEVLDKFRNGVKCLVLNPQSAAHGLTLNEATTSVYYNNSYNLEHRLQSLGRNYRIGQTNRTLVVDFVSPNTIEPVILAALKKKEDVAKQLIRKEELLELLL